MAGAPRLPRRAFLRASRDIALGLGTVGVSAVPAGCDGGGEVSKRPRPPNIVLFLVDDLGGMDCGHCGSAFYRTPNMDRLADEGVRFTNAYSPSPLCSASRAAILTGKFPHRIGVTGAIACGTTCVPVTTPALPATAAAWQKVITPSFLTQLPLAEQTIADYLSPAGYTTGFFGKWHLGGSGYGPSEQGFQHVFAGGPEGGPKSHFEPYGLSGVTDEGRGEYLADRVTREAERFIQQYAGAPFFALISHYGVHMPLHAPEALIAKYHALRNPRAAQRNAAFAAMIESVDASLGRLLDCLERLALAEDTLVVLTSDNGGLSQTLFDAFLLRITSAGPFRGGKSAIYEGGIRVPLLVRQRGVIPPAVSDEVVSGLDLLPTFLQAAGVPLPVVDGSSLRDHLMHRTPVGERSLFWHFPHGAPLRVSTAIAIDEQARSLPATAVRRGNYKLVRLYGEGVAGKGYALELYDLSADPGETHNIAPLFPDLVDELDAAITDNMTATGALVPVANPAYRESHDGWRVRKDAQCVAGHGYLRITPNGPDPQLISPVIDIAQAVELVVRLRAPAEIVLTVFTALTVTPVFSNEQRFDRRVPASASFREIVIALPAYSGRRIRRLRLDPGGGSAQVDIDEIAIRTSAGQPVQSWRFDGVSGLPYGGSWFSWTDTFVACGPGSLGVELAGPSPVIISPPVTLFGPLRIRLRMRSTGSGDGLIAWSHSLQVVTAPSHEVAMPLPHDGQWHQHDVLLDDFGDAPVARLLLGLGQGVGSAEIDWIKVFDAQDSLMLSWDFCPGVD